MKKLSFFSLAAIVACLAISCGSQPTTDSVSENPSTVEPSTVVEPSISVNLSEYKETAKNELDSYVLLSDYLTTERNLVKNYINNGKIAIDNATSSAEIDSIVASTKSSIDSVKTREQKQGEALMTAKEEACAALDSYRSTEGLTADQINELQAAIAEGKANINAATSTREVSTALNAAKEKIDAIGFSYRVVHGSAKSAPNNGIESVLGNTIVLTNDTFSCGTLSFTMTLNGSGGDNGIVFGVTNQNSRTDFWEENDISYYFVFIDAGGNGRLGKVTNGVWSNEGQGSIIGYTPNGTYSFDVVYNTTGDIHVIDVLINGVLCVSSKQAVKLSGIEYGYRAGMDGIVYSEITKSNNTEVDKGDTEVDGYSVASGLFGTDGDYVVSKTGNALAVKDGVTFQYGTLECEITLNGPGSDNGIVFALTPNSVGSYWESDVSYYFWFLSLGGTAYLGKVDNGSWSICSNEPIVGFNNTGTYTLKIVRDPDGITGYVNDVEYCVYTEEDVLEGTLCGLRAGGTGIKYRNLNVESAGEIVVTYPTDLDVKEEKSFTGKNGSVVAKSTNNVALLQCGEKVRGTLSANIVASNNNPVGLIFGYQNDGSTESYYMFYAKKSGQAVELALVTNNTYKVLFSSYMSAGVSNGNAYRFKVVLDEGKAYCYYFNTCYTVYKSDDLKGRVGFGSQIKGSRFRDYAFSDVPSVETYDTLIFGHSYTELWTYYKNDLKDMTVIKDGSVGNCGIGGSIATHWVALKEGVVSYQPKLGVYWIGVNDLTGYIPGQNVTDQVEELMLYIKNAIPEFECMLLGNNHCNARDYIASDIDKLNVLYRALADKYDWIYYVEMENAFDDANGNPIASWFKDGLHPSDAGYTQKLVPEMEKTALVIKAFYEMRDYLDLNEYYIDQRAEIADLLAIYKAKLTIEMSAEQKAAVVSEYKVEADKIETKAEQDAKVDLPTYKANKMDDVTNYVNPNDYDATDKSTIKALLATCKESINVATTKDEVDAAVTAYKTAVIELEPASVKVNKAKAIYLNNVNAIDVNGYRSEEQSAVNALKENMIRAIETANTIEAINSIDMDGFNKSIAAIKTNAVYTIEEMGSFAQNSGWTLLDDHRDTYTYVGNTLHFSGQDGYALDTHNYGNEFNIVINLHSDNAAIGIAGVLFAHKNPTTDGVDGYLFNYAYNDSIGQQYYQVYYLKNCYGSNNDGVICQYIGGWIYTNEYPGQTVRNTDVRVIVKDGYLTMYNNNEYLEKGNNAFGVAVELTSNGTYQLVSDLQFGIIGWGNPGIFDLEVKSLCGKTPINGAEKAKEFLPRINSAVNVDILDATKKEIIVAEREKTIAIINSDEKTYAEKFEAAKYYMSYAKKLGSPSADVDILEDSSDALIDEIDAKSDKISRSGKTIVTTPNENVIALSETKYSDISFVVKVKGISDFNPFNNGKCENATGIFIGASGEGETTKGYFISFLTTGGDVSNAWVQVHYYDGSTYKILTSGQGIALFNGYYDDVELHISVINGVLRITTQVSYNNGSYNGATGYDFGSAPNGIKLNDYEGGSVGILNNGRPSSTIFTFVEFHGVVAE